MLVANDIARCRCHSTSSARASDASVTSLPAHDIFVTRSDRGFFSDTQPLNPVNEMVPSHWTQIRVQRMRRFAETLLRLPTASPFANTDRSLNRRRYATSTKALARFSL